MNHHHHHHQNNSGAVVDDAAIASSPASDQICPICQDTLQEACETSCGHFFCGKCLTDYWNSLPPEAPKKCPLDRKVVTFVIPSHGARQRVRNAHGSAPSSTSRRTEGVYARGATSQAPIDEELYTWNSILNNQARPFYDISENAHLLHRFYEGTEDDHPPAINKVILLILCVVIFLYFISPFDLIPDHFPIVGFLDDLLLPIMTFLFALPRLYRLYILSQAFAGQSSA